MKALSIARKTLLELLREPLLLGLLFLFPIFFIGLYYIAFGETEQGLAKYLSIQIVNQDSGVSSEEFIEEIRSAEFEGKPIFNVALLSNPKSAEIPLSENKSCLLLVIPPDFTKALLYARQGIQPKTPVIITIAGKPTSTMFVMARSMLESTLRDFIKRAIGWQNDVLRISYEFVAGTGTMSDFDFGVAGIIVFGVMFVAVSTAQIMVRENANGNLRRLRLTCAQSKDLLLGVTLSQMLIAVVAVPVIFLSAVVFGFRSNGSLWLAMGIAFLLSLSAVGLGLLTACFVKDEGSAANLSGVIMVFSVLLSGAIYPMPAVPIAHIGKRIFQIYDFLPTAHAGEAMRKVLILGDGLAAITYELGMITILSVLILAVGIIMYQKLQLRNT